MSVENVDNYYFQIAIVILSQQRKSKIFIFNKFY